jgi:hypothetical protein
MTRQYRTIGVSARAGGPKVAPALRGLERLSKVARESVRIARAAASIALPGDYRWQLPSKGPLLKNKQDFEAGLFRRREAARDGSGTGSVGELGWSETDSLSTTARGGRRWNRARAKVNASARASRELPELSRAMNALSRIEGSVDFGKMNGATADSRKHARLMVATDARRRGRGDETVRPSFADAGVLANVRVAPSIRGVVPPPGVSQREFAPPASHVRVPNDARGRAAITINSSPTVVINAAAGGAVQQDVIGALRAHREELFDQLKRESARRERAQF